MLVALAMVAVGASAQTTLLGYAGYGQSAFEDQEDAAGYIPVGAEILVEMSPGLSVGAEVDYAVVPFTWEYEYLGTKVGETKVGQMVLGGLARFEMGQGSLRPHVRGGAGLYMGKAEFEAEEGSGMTDSETDYKNAFGFNVGAGLTADFGETKIWMLEFVYHIVSREMDVEGAESFGANNWALHLGAGMKF
jgi:opacity protein-like surface antigen